MERKTLLFGLFSIFTLVFLVLSGSLFQNIDANEIVCIQSPISGKLTWHTTPGTRWQGFGKVSVYKKLKTYIFEIPVRFNDGGHGTIFGSINYEIPFSIDLLNSLHMKYGSDEAIQKQLIETITNKCVYMTGPLMSSKESYAEKRTNLISYIEDQIANGVYKTKQSEVKTKDQMTGQDKTVTVVEIVIGKNGKPERQEDAVLNNYGIKTSNFAVTRLPYDEAVENQIKQQQGLVMQVQTAIASAKEAEQSAITIAKQGESSAAKAKWEQEVIKAKEVTLAQQKYEVSVLEAKSAEQQKRRDILLGEGEGSRKRLVMQADGALDKKLEAWVEVNKLYAEAIKGYAGQWVPAIVMGDQKSSNGATALVDLLTAKTAKELGLEIGMRKQ